MPWRNWENRRIRGGTLVDYGEPGLDRGAVPGINRTVDRGREPDHASVLDVLEFLAPSQAIRREGE
jgi:hypothetical protein